MIAYQYHQVTRPFARVEYIKKTYGISMSSPEGQRDLPEQLLAVQAVAVHVQDALDLIDAAILHHQVAGGQVQGQLVVR